MEPEPLVVPGTLRGYRAWSPKVGPKPGTIELLPVNWWAGQALVTWDGLTCNAECRVPMTWRLQTRTHPGPHQAPKWNCSCGIYARYATITQDEQQMRIVGSIQASGRIILHQRGFRAEHAVVEAVTAGPMKIPGLNSDALLSMVKRFADYYKIPSFQTLEELQRELPPHDVYELLSIRA